jgi:hypothetical protein
MAIYYPGRQPAAQMNERGFCTHSYASGTTDWTLNKAEAKCEYLYVTLAGGAVNIVAPLVPGKTFYVYNASVQAVTLKVAGGSGIAVANSKVAMVFCNASDYIRGTADATY